MSCLFPSHSQRTNRSLIAVHRYPLSPDSLALVLRLSRSRVPWDQVVTRRSVAAAVVARLHNSAHESSVRLRCVLREKAVPRDPTGRQSNSTALIPWVRVPLLSPSRRCSTTGSPRCAAGSCRTPTTPGTPNCTIGPHGSPLDLPGTMTTASAWSRLTLATTRAIVAVGKKMNEKTKVLNNIQISKK